MKENDIFLKKVYFMVKELFTQKENSLYDVFYNDETSGFEEFKKNVVNDETLNWIFNDNILTDSQAEQTAITIISKINRYYYMSVQNNISK